MKTKSRSRGESPASPSIDLSRRELLKAGALSGAGLILPLGSASRAFAAGGLQPFVDSLPIPSVIQPTSIVGGVAHYQVAMTQFKQRLHRDLPLTTVWGYGDARSPRGSFPGPLFETRKGHPIKVRWTNGLPATHMLPIDPTLHGAEESVPAVRTVVHLHGAKVLPESDGHPDAWFTAGFAQKGSAFAHETYEYPNDQAATALWYHDHALGIVRLNVYAGLAGIYNIRDAEEDGLNLPRGRYEVPLVLMDRMFNPNGSLNYPTFDASDPEVPPIWMPEFFGDSVLVNGRVWPYLEVEPRKYRFRMLNASNARFYHLQMVQTDKAGNPLGGARPVPAFNQIGADQGLLPQPVSLNELLIAPAERMDLVVDFSRFAGKNLVITNDAKAPYPDGDDVIPAQVMQFRVADACIGTDTSSLPRNLSSVPLINPQSASRTRNIALTELGSAQDNPIMGMLGQALWSDPVTEDPRPGATELWRLINTTGDAHPLHIHLVRFQIINRQPFDSDRYLATGDLVFTGQPEAPAANERPAWKDVARTMPGYVTRVIQKFDLPSGTPVSSGQRFNYVFHCHILEHEDNEMMRPFDVVVP